ncbi:MAG: hypothetical protein ACI8RZ_005710 [Myxococcota bacterium]|jgi:hypothetical protein
MAWRISTMYAALELLSGCAMLAQHGGGDLFGDRTEPTLLGEVSQRIHRGDLLAGLVAQVQLPAEDGDQQPGSLQAGAQGVPVSPALNGVPEHLREFFEGCPIAGLLELLGDRRDRLLGVEFVPVDVHACSRLGAQGNGLHCPS